MFTAGNTELLSTGWLYKEMEFISVLMLNCAECFPLHLEKKKIFLKWRWDELRYILKEKVTYFANSIYFSSILAASDHSDGSDDVTKTYTVFLSYNESLQNKTKQNKSNSTLQGKGAD